MYSIPKSPHDLSLPEVRYWSMMSGQLLAVMRGHRGPVRAVVGLPQRQCHVIEHATI